jgi:O-antigen/teichoic acid export membrane protein
MALLGLGSYSFLIISGRSLGLADFGRLASLWALVFGVVGGLVFPFEQESVRVVAEQGRGAELRRISVLLAGVVAFVLLAGAAWWLWSPAWIRGGAGFAVALAVSVVTLPVAGLTRGALLGAERFGSAGVELALEGLLRAAGVVVLASLGRGFVWFAVLLAIAPLISAFAVLPAVFTVPRATGIPRAWPVLIAELGTLALGTGIALMVLNIGPLLVNGLGGPTSAGRFTAAFTLVRLPVFFAGPIAGALLPRFVRAYGTGELRGALRRELLPLAGLAVVAALLLGALTPFLVRSLYGPKFLITVGSSLVLGLSAAVHLVAVILQASLIAAGRRRRIVLGWSLGLGVLIAMASWLPGAVVERVSWAYLASAAVTVGVMVVGRAGGRAKATSGGSGSQTV